MQCLVKSISLGGGQQVLPPRPNPATLSHQLPNPATLSHQFSSTSANTTGEWEGDRHTEKLSKVYDLRGSWIYLNPQTK